MDRQPTKPETDDALLVELEVEQAITRMAAVGIEPLLLLAGTATALSKLVGVVHGEPQIGTWWAKQAAIIQGVERQN